MNAPRLRFGEPPEPRGTHTDWDDVARKLRDRPGDWARVGVYAVSVAAHVRSGRIVAFRPVGHYEARYDRTDQPGRGVIWVRYVGAQEPEPTQ